MDEETRADKELFSLADGVIADTLVDIDRAGIWDCEPLADT